MLPRSFCTPDNAQRAKQFGVAAIVVAGALFAYIAFSTITEAQGLWKSMHSLRTLKSQSERVSTQVRASEQRAASFRTIDEGSFDAFAVQFTGWAKARGVRIDSLNPEGSSTVKDANTAGKSLGKWKAEQIQIEGTGRFEQVLSLIEALGNPNMPVQLQAYSMDAAEDGKSGNVVFKLKVNVFKEDEKASTGS